MPLRACSHRPGLTVRRGGGAEEFIALERIDDLAVGGDGLGVGYAAQIAVGDVGVDGRIGGRQRAGEGGVGRDGGGGGRLRWNRQALRQRALAQHGGEQGRQQRRQ